MYFVDNLTILKFSFQGDDDEEDEKETEDNQDGFFVPHVYLSDDEGVNDASDDEENEYMADNDEKCKPTLSKEGTDGKRVCIYIKDT